MDEGGGGAIVLGVSFLHAILNYRWAQSAIGTVAAFPSLCLKKVHFHKRFGLVGLLILIGLVYRYSSLVS